MEEKTWVVEAACSVFGDPADTHTHQVKQRLGRERDPREERLDRKQGPGEETPWQQGKEIAAWSTRLGRSPGLRDL